MYISEYFDYRIELRTPSTLDLKRSKPRNATYIMVPDIEDKLVSMLDTIEMGDTLVLIDQREPLVDCADDPGDTDYPLHHLFEKIADKPTIIACFAYDLPNGERWATAQAKLRGGKSITAQQVRNLIRKVNQAMR